MGRLSNHWKGVTSVRENAGILGGYISSKLHPSSTHCQEQPWKDYVLARACSTSNILRPLQVSVAACSWQFKLKLRKDSLWKKPQRNCFAPLGWLCGSPSVLQLPQPTLAARRCSGAPKGARTSTAPWPPPSVSPCDGSVAPYWSLPYSNINPLPILLTNWCLQLCRDNTDNLKIEKIKKKDYPEAYKETVINRIRTEIIIRQNIAMQIIYCTLPSCHFFEHMVSIIQMGNAGSSIAMAMFAKQIDP